jgi:hypothetical protein
MPADGLDRLLAVLGLGDHRQVRFGLQDEPESAADQRLVVGQHHADRHRPPSWSTAWTRNPP